METAMAHDRQKLIDEAAKLTDEAAKLLGTLQWSSSCHWDRITQLEKARDGCIQRLTELQATLKLAERIIQEEEKE
jgi:hypothetical protein